MVPPASSPTDPREAAVVLRVFHAFADGRSESSIVRELNDEGVAGRRKSSRGWSPATVHRVLRNEKYVGRWVWNKSETRRDPRSGRRRQFPKPEADWIVTEDETLRIVPARLWERVQARLAEVRTTWPGGVGKRGFEGQRGGRVRHYPTDLLSGSMVCGSCGSSIVKVSGKNGGYYGCLGAAKNACGNKLLVRRSLAERIVLAAVRDRLASSENLAYVFERVKEEISRSAASAPETVSMKQAELEQEERRLANFLEFVADGRGSKALAHALMATERKVDGLRAELEMLRRRVDSPAGPEAGQSLPGAQLTRLAISSEQELGSLRSELDWRTQIERLKVESANHVVRRLVAHKPEDSFTSLDDLLAASRDHTRRVASSREVAMLTNPMRQRGLALRSD